MIAKKKEQENEVNTITNNIRGAHRAPVPLRADADAGAGPYHIISYHIIAYYSKCIVYVYIYIYIYSICYYKCIIYIYMYYYLYIYIYIYIINL